MSRIIPSLNLNKTPQSVEDRSLVYAKNIRMFPDQTFGPDNSIVTKVDKTSIKDYFNETDENILYDIIGHINGIDNNIYLFVSKYTPYQSICYLNIPDLTNVTSITVRTYKKSNNAKITIIEETLGTENLVSEINKILQCSVVPDSTEERALFDLTQYIIKGSDEYTIQPEEVSLCVTSEGNINCIWMPIGTIITVSAFNPEIISYKTDSYIKYNIGSTIYVYKIVDVCVFDGGGANPQPIDIQTGHLTFNKDNDITNVEGKFITLNNKLYYIVKGTSDSDTFLLEVTQINYINEHQVEFDFNYPFYFNDNCNIIENEIKSVGSILKENDTFNITVGNTYYNNLYIEIIYYNNNEVIEQIDKKLNANTLKLKDLIIDYKEIDGSIKEIKSGWKWSGGIIEGVTTVNNTNQPILNIGEYFEQDTGINIPIKHINVKECKETDDESIYTQAPNVPLTNFTLINTFTHSIPNGVYQFFVRYKIRDNFYTNWFVCSKECFAGSRELTNTIFGSLSYVKTKANAGSSFVFSVEHLHPEYFKLYEGYQVGYILTTDDKTVARSWKTFTFEGAVDGRTNSIYFDLNEKDIQEVDIDEMLSTPYNIYNAKNIDYFRGKLYISNYKEDNFNPNNLSDYINKINIDLKFKHFTIQTNNDFFHEKLLTPSPETLGTYIQIQDTDIKSLIYKDNKDLSLQIRNTTKDSTVDYDFDNPLCYVRSVWNSNINPDMLYIDQTIRTNIIGIPEYNDSGREGDWRDFFESNSFIFSAIASVREKGDNEKHWLKGNKYLDGIWYWTEQGNNFGQESHEVRDNGIGTGDAINNNITSVITKLWQAINENCPNRCIVTAVKLSLGTDETLTTVYEVPNHNRGDRHNLLGDAFPITDPKALSNFALNKIEDGVTKLNSAGYFYYGNKVINEIKVEYSEISYNIKNESEWENPFSSDDKGFNSVIKIDSSKTNYTLSILCTANTALFDLGSTKLEAIQYNTLMPYTDYDFYIHYITKTGVITNGIYICSKKVTEFEINSIAANGINKSLIYPEIKGIEIPEEYESCFISYYKHNNNVAQCFDILTPGNGGDADTDKNSIRVNILEADMLLYRLNDKIQIYHRNSYNDIPILIGDYYSSNSTKSSTGGSGISFDEFGNAGIIKGVYNGSYDIYESINSTFANDNCLKTKSWFADTYYTNSLLYKVDLRAYTVPDYTDVYYYQPISASNEFANANFINSFVTVNFNTSIIENDGVMPTRYVKPEITGTLSITLLLDKRNISDNEDYIQAFLDTIFPDYGTQENPNTHTPSTDWNSFYNGLPDGLKEGDNKNRLVSLYNFNEFGKVTLGDCDKTEQIYCQIKKLNPEDGLPNTPVKCTVETTPGEQGNDTYNISINYRGSNIGFEYTDENGNIKVCKINKINIIHGELENTLAVPCVKNDNYSGGPSVKELAAEGFSYLYSRPVLPPGESWTIIPVYQYEAKSLVFTGVEIAPIDGDMWCRNKAYTSIDETAKRLIKLTPYLTYELNVNNERLPISFNSYTKMNTDSYICQITKPDRNKSLSVYAAGNDLYGINRTGTDMKLESVNNLVASTYSDIRYIYSNFNLNYMSLSYDLVPKLRANLDHQQLYLSPESAELSNCYKLEGMYKDFARKYFAPYNKYNMTIFDNTVRSSDSNTDEIHRSIYRFDAEDMYNIPANRGKITKMFSIANAIYIHTEHSLFKFSGENTLSGSENDVKLEESNVFDTGISEIFDSENGFGGLHEKHNCLITYKNYFFYDTRSKLIYVYTGNGELQNINEPIKKLFDFLKISDVRFGSDLRNDRIFIYLKGEKGNVCLSYNTETKHYVSIHDINIIDSFSTRNNLYFISKENIGNKGDKAGTISLLNGFDYNAFGNYGNVFVQSPYITNKELSLISTHPNDLYCVIDVIINSNPEDIKNLDNVSWICHHIKNYLDIITSGNYQYYDMDNAAEEAKYKYPGEYIQLYTDSCDTGNIELYDINNVEHRNVDIYGANAYSINNELSYKYPRYNEGVWNLNYFRNIKGVIGNAADNKSLIYGKYIVARFIFKADYNFKLENVMFNVKSR